MSVVGFLLSILLIQTPDPLSATIQGKTNLPDLIIEQVAYRTRRIKPEYKPGEPRRGSDGRMIGEFVLIIRNIGSSAFYETLSISIAQTEEDVATGIFVGSSTVNNARTIVGPGGILEVTIAARPDLDIGALVRFRIEPPEKEGFVPAYQEERYDNNEFELVIAY